MTHRDLSNPPRPWPVETILKMALLALAFASLTVSATARAADQVAERVQLANGFSMQCNHHALVNGKFRIYPHADETEFLDLDAATVTAVTSVELSPVAPGAVPTSVSEPERATDRIIDRLTPAELHQMLTSAGSQHNLDADLLASVVQAESNGNARAVSRAGAAGLMQLMPQTARQLGVSNTFAPDQNIHGGAAYLDQMLTRYHDNLALALAAYNAGPEAVDRYHGIPPYRETQLYVARVIHLFNQRVATRRVQQNQANNHIASAE